MGNVRPIDGRPHTKGTAEAFKQRYNDLKQCFMSYIFLNYLITHGSQNVLERTFLVFHVFCDITVKRAISDDSQFSRTGENL